MKKFSFVIPTFKNKTLLKNCLETLNRQRGFGRDYYEVIVVDDGSNDDTYEHIKGVNKNYDLQYLYLERCGDSCRSRARNMGVRVSEGEIIVFIDADIILREDYISEINRCYSLYDDILLIGSRVLLNEDVPYETVCDVKNFNNYLSSKQVKAQINEHFLYYYRFSFNMYCYDYPWMHALTCNMAIPRKHIEKIGGFDENYKEWGFEDTDLAYRLYKESIKVILNSKMYVFHQKHISSLNPDEIKKTKEAHQDKNISYFVSKHPEAFKGGKDEIIEMIEKWQYLQTSEKNMPLKKKNLHFKNIEEVDDIEKQILALSDDKEYKIRINDYLENTHLDIWIQHLGIRNSTPKYFPMSIIQEIAMNFVR